MQHDDWVRITSYLDGEATPAERRALERWLAEDPARQAAFERVRQVHEAAKPDALEHSSAEALVSNWEAVRQQTEQAGGDGYRDERAPARTRRAPVRRRRRFGAVQATMAVALIACGIWAALTLGDAGLGAAPELAQTWTTMSTQNARITLADGSQVRLGPETTLTQPDPSARQFELVGEARFEVTRDVARPFVVQTQHGSTRVLGTTFTVDSGANDAAMVVSVEEGRVAVRSVDAEGEVVLEAGHMARASLGISPVRLDALTPARDAPVVASLRFDDASLADVAAALAEVHGIRLVVADSALAQVPVTTDLTDLSLDEALEALEAFVGVAIERQGGAITLTPADQ
ncbi:MAG: FecR domain-containing protein [Bacteroidota bacterium]